MKLALLSCDDLQDHIVDENIFHKELKKSNLIESFEVLSWSAQTDWSQYDLAVVRTTWDYTKHLERFLKALEHIESQGCKVLNPPSLIRWNAKKSYLKDLESKGASVLKALFLEDLSLNASVSALENFKEKNFVLKPLVGASAIGIEVLSKEDLELRLAELYKTQSHKNYFVQAFTDRVYKGEISYFFFNGGYQYAIRKTPQSGDFRVQEEYGGLITEHFPLEDEIEKALNVQSLTPEHHLYARVDVLFDEQGWDVMELELIEPSLFFRVVDSSAHKLCKAIEDFSQT